VVAAGLVAYDRIVVRLDILGLPTRDREALGVSEVLKARILRSDQGGYWSFSPPSVWFPR
jgi:hypothetical protein